jgi:hypothetical protein
MKASHQAFLANATCGACRHTIEGLGKRNSRDRVTGKPVVRYCVRFFDDDGKVALTKTLKATGMTAAAIEAKSLYDRGEGKARCDPLVLDFLADFWRFDSDYAKMKKLRGRPLSLHYVEISAMIIRKHLARISHSKIGLRSRNERSRTKFSGAFGTEHAFCM